jgi:exoribonuclease R
MKLYTKNYKQFTLDKGSISFDDYHQANRCLPGDEVDWDGSKCTLIQRADHRILVGVLELNSKYIYGHTSRGVKIYLFHPFDTSYPPMRVGCSEKDTSKNQLALVRFSDWTEAIPRGNLQRLLGPVGNVDAEKQALQWFYGKPELAKISFEIPVKESERISLEGQTINIDPEGCKDIDDLVTLIQKDDSWDFYITIADVAESIEVDSPGDLLAKEKSQTLYQNGEAVLPMLPRELSENKLSLLPGEKRNGVALHCLWENSKLTVKRFLEVTVTNQKSYTYDSIYSSDFPVSILQDIASYLKGEEIRDSHEWIEQFMILYNLEGAKILLQMKNGFLRTHKEADLEKVQQLQTIHPDLKYLAFQSARYEFAEEGKIHATLGNKPYTHLSSPLRRYADLVNQRILKASLRGNHLETVDRSLAELLNLQQKRQKQFERDVFFLEQILQGTTGVLDGIVVETGEKKKVYIPQWKKIVRVETEEEISVGMPIKIEYFADLRKVSWKQRIVFQRKQESQ